MAESAKKATITIARPPRIIGYCVSVNVGSMKQITRARSVGKHSILAVDFMFDLEIARVRSIPMALQRHPHGSIIHLNLPPALPAIILRPLNSLCCTLF